MIESFVDLTYRGLALGRRIKLTEVRPSTAFVELPAPMPVGTRVAIVTDDGLALDATVTWIHEQVAGSDRLPGMVVAPVLAAEAAAAWWQARVALPESESPRPQPSRTRPVTVRPRATLERTPPNTQRTQPVADTDEIPTIIAIPPKAPANADEDGATIIADLQARVLAAAGLEASAAPSIHERATVAMSAVEDPATHDAAGDVTVAAIPVDAGAAGSADDDSAGEVTLAHVAPPSGSRDVASDTIPADTLALYPVSPDDLPPDTIPPDTIPPDTMMSDTIPPLSARRTGEHDVVDDGKATMIMDAIDPSTLGLDLPLGSDARTQASRDDAEPTAIGDEPSAPVITIEPGSDDDGDGDGDDDAASAGASDAGVPADKPAGRSKRRRKRR